MSTNDLCPSFFLVSLHWAGSHSAIPSPTLAGRGPADGNRGRRSVPSRAPGKSGSHESDRPSSARKKKSEFLRRVSITIAKGNSRDLDCIRHDGQSATAPDLVTSTVPNPRTLAATSDPDIQNPTAATPLAAGGGLSGPLADRGRLV